MTPELPPAWARFLEERDVARDNIRDLPVVRPVDPAEVRAAVESGFGFERPRPLEQVVDQVADLLRRWTVHVTHPRYFGLYNPSVREAGVIADALTSLYNPQLAAWSHAPAAQEMERHVLRKLAGVLGLDADRTLASFTTGGAEANLSAILAALAHRFPEADRGGVAALPVRPAIYLTEESHHSFLKVARMTGLGTDAVRRIPTTERFVMDPEALRARITGDRAEGWSPLAIVGTAGTTGAGMVDPLPRLADIAAQEGAWFHVDAAWGAGAMFSARLRPLLAGIERADSVTWDAHKWLSVPIGTGMIFCRHPDALRCAFAVDTTYMPGASGGGTVDPYAVTAQWTRRAIGLRIFLALAELGTDGYAGLIEHQAEMGAELRQRLSRRGWEVVNDTPLPVVCFTHPEIRAGRVTTTKLLRTVYARGRVWISDVVLGGRERVLRACVTSYLTQPDDVDVLVEEVEVAMGR